MSACHASDIQFISPKYYWIVSILPILCILSMSKHTVQTLLCVAGKVWLRKSSRVSEIKIWPNTKWTESDRMREIIWDIWKCYDGYCCLINPYRIHICPNPLPCTPNLVRAIEDSTQLDQWWFAHKQRKTNKKQNTCLHFCTMSDLYIAGFNDVVFKEKLQVPSFTVTRMKMCFNLPNLTHIHFEKLHNTITQLVPWSLNESVRFSGRASHKVKRSRWPRLPSHLAVRRKR